MKNNIPNMALHLILILSIFCLSINGELRLVDSKDYITIYDQSKNKLSDKEISAFKDYSNFDQTNEVTGAYLGYLSNSTIDNDTFNQQGGDKVPEGSVWILAIKFDNGEFGNTLEFVNNNSDTIPGSIFTYGSNIQIQNGANKYDKIEIISFASNDQIKDFEKYAFPNSEGNTGNLTHTFINDGSIIDPAFTYYIIVICLWVVVLLVHWIWTWIYMRGESFVLQKIMTVLPCFFIGVLLLNFFYFKSCPWLDNTRSQYISIINIAIETIFNTLFVGFCLFVSRGWKIVKSTFGREELSRITLVVGIFYLAYSAYFIASDIDSLRVIIILVLALMYLGILVFCFTNCLKNIKAIKYHISQALINPVMLEGLKLKLFLVRWVGLSCCLFFFNKIIYLLLYQFITDNYICRALLIINLFTEFLIVTFLMFILRTRKWMEYYSLDVLMPNVEDAANNNLVNVDILTADVPRAWILDHNKNARMSDIIVNKQQITKFKKNNKYLNANEAVLINYSAPKWHEIDENNDTDFKSTVYENTALCIQEEISDDESSD